MKSASAKTKVRLVPNRSPIQPDAGITIASVSRYAITVHWTSVNGTPNASDSVGSATLTICMSIPVMKIAVT